MIPIALFKKFDRRIKKIKHLKRIRVKFQERIEKLSFKLSKYSKKFLSFYALSNLTTDGWTHRLTE